MKQSEVNGTINSAKPAIVVNGRAVPVDPKSHTSLLLFLRNELQLTGTKPGCGKGDCGACSVLSDGTVVQSCQVSLAAALENNIETIEHIVQTPLGKQIVAALIRKDAAQCGYCLPGIVVAAYADFQTAEFQTANIPDPVRALQRNLCRCGSHSRILSALHEVTTALDSK